MKDQKSQILRRPETSSTQAQTQCQFNLSQYSTINKNVNREENQPEESQIQQGGRAKSTLVIQQKFKSKVLTKQGKVRYQIDENKDDDREEEDANHQIIFSQFQKKQPLLERSDSPTLNKGKIPRQHESQKPVQGEIRNYNQISYNDIIEKYRLNQPHASKKVNTKCSCFVIKTTKSIDKDFFKQNLLNKGKDKFSADEQEHRDIVYSIFVNITNENKLSDLVFQTMTKEIVNFFQIFQFLSCVEFFKNITFELVDKMKFELFVYIMNRVCLYIFKMLQNNKLDVLQEKYTQDQLLNLLRNYQMGIMHHILNYEYQEAHQNINLDAILSKYEQFKNQIYFLDYFLQSRNQFD